VAVVEGSISTKEIAMRLTIPTLALTVVALGSAASAQAAQVQVVARETSLQEAAVALGHDYDEFYGKKDVTGMVSLYATDAELVSPGGKIIKGHDALAAYYRARFASGATGHKITIEETHGTGDTGYSVATFSVSVPNAGHSTEHHVESGHIAAVYVHDVSGWHFGLVQPSVTPAEGG
jgi:ketosteroid isomerase-like protein